MRGITMSRFRTMITAHAGAEDTPANTMESIRILAACGADAVEVDVRLLIPAVPDHKFTYMVA